MIGVCMMQNISFQSISDSRIPIAITDLTLTLQYGNHSLYTLIGNDLFYSIYKVVLPRDRSRLEECIQNIAVSKMVTDVFSILYSDNEYHHMVLHFTYIRNNRFIKIEFQYLSDIINQQELLEDELVKYRTLFTLVGDRIFEYNSASNLFKFYWINEKQNILNFQGDLNTWQDDILSQNLIAKEDKTSFLDLCKFMQNTVKSFECQMSTSILSNGEIFESTKVKGVTIKDSKGKKNVIGVWFPFNEIYNSKENHFIDNLYKDELTGLLNKREVTQYAQNLFLHPPGYPVYLLILDLDNFKQCNDMFGHMFGDEILTIVAAILKNTIQQHGVAGRIGGDEFLIVLENIESEKLLRNMLRSIRANIQWLYKEKLTAFQLGCSMGVACFPKDATDYDTLFKLADYSLYLAKNKGKCRYIIYDKKLHGTVSCNKADNSILTQTMPLKNPITLSEVKKKIALLYPNGKSAIPEVFEALKQYFNFCNVSIYIPDLTFGELDLLNQHILIYLPLLFQADYLALFLESDAYCVTNIKNIEFTHRPIYHHFTSTPAVSYYQCILVDAAGIKRGIISYERSSIHYAWTNETKQLLSLFSALVGSIIFITPL